MYTRWIQSVKGSGMYEESSERGELEGGAQTEITCRRDGTLEREADRLIDGDFSLIASIAARIPRDCM